MSISNAKLYLKGIIKNNEDNPDMQKVIGQIKKALKELEDYKPFNGFPKISELAKMLGKTTMTSDTIVRRWERSSPPPIPIKDIYVGSSVYEVNNGFTKRKKYDKGRITK